MNSGRTPSPSQTGVTRRFLPQCFGGAPGVIHLIRLHLPLRVQPLADVAQQIEEVICRRLRARPGLRARQAADQAVGTEEVEGEERGAPCPSGANSQTGCVPL